MNIKDEEPAGNNELPVSRETVDLLLEFKRFFEKWSKTINLIAPSTRGDIWSRHILDSAQIYRLFPGPYKWIDLGSGGGFPGLITALLMREAPGGWVHLVESNKKKAAFLRAAILEFDLDASVHPIRIEDAPQEIEKCDAISARALSNLSQLLSFSEIWMRRNGETKAFFNKGRDYRKELDEANSGWSFDLVIHNSDIETDSVILEISSLVKS